MKQKKENGMTLIALAITIIVLAIIAAISITAGGNVIRASQLESLKTNMLLIQAKTKEYVEEVSFKRGPVHEADIENIRSEIYEQKGGLINSVSVDAPNEVKELVSKLSAENGNVYYYVPREALDKVGLSSVEEGKSGDYYVVQFDEDEVTVEVFNTKGFRNDSKYYYSLTQLEQIEEVK